MVQIKKKQRKKEILQKIYSSLTIEVNVEKKKRVKSTIQTCSFVDYKRY